LGVLTRAQGDIAATCRLFANALRVYHDQGEKWALAFMLEDTAVVTVLASEPELALELAGAGAALREEIGAPRGPADQAELDAQLAPAREALGAAADDAFAAGRSLE